MKKILIVDDRTEIRKLLSITLGLDYEVFTAGDGEQALATFKAVKPDAVLLDVMMPGDFDGFDVLQKIKSNPQTSKTLVAMITAKGNGEQIKQAQTQGADAFFVKPFSPLKLVSWLQENLQKDHALS